MFCAIVPKDKEKRERNCELLHPGSKLMRVAAAGQLAESFLRRSKAAKDKGAKVIRRGLICKVLKFGHVGERA